MKICIFLSGHVRTLFYKFHENIELIKNTIDDCHLDVRYSFWDDYSIGGKLNDPWHIQSENFIQPEISTDIIDNYFLSHGVEDVKGEIESVDIMKQVLENTKFLPEKSGRNVLSSQYYKKNRVVQKYFNEDYDFYIQIRSDITIENFPIADLINSIIDKKSLVISEYYWYNEPYIGTDCNEMINCSTRNVFKELNEIYLNEDKISKQLDYHYGERVTGRHIQNMIQSGSIDNLCIFDYGFRVIR